MKFANLTLEFFNLDSNLESNLDSSSAARIYTFFYFRFSHCKIFELD